MLDLTCSVTVCQQKFDDFRDLLKHLKNHIYEGLLVNCPLKIVINRIALYRLLPHISVGVINYQIIPQTEL